jgi:hypothetical protein
MTLEVECLVGPGQDLYHLALLHAGLLELERGGEITLRFRSVRGHERALSRDAHTLLYCRQRGRELRVAVDLYDRANRWEEILLGACDVYFKRGYWTPEVERRPERPKIRRLGLNFAARAVRGSWRPAWAAGLPGWWHYTRNRGMLRQFWDSPAISRFERPPGRRAEAKIIFQPRLWDAGDTDDNTEEVNEMRVELVRTLRRNFGARFTGGLLPTALARRRYPEWLASGPVSREAYVRESLRHAIGINVRGLHFSNPFKLGEYLAGAFAVVSDPIRHELPTPLLAGRDFLEFLRPEQCAAHCERLLGDPEELIARRTAAWNYYRSQLAPAAMWRQRLQEAFAA